MKSNPSRKQFALVKWLDGDCKDTYTHNVEVSWIRGFDPDSLPFEDSFAIEWRQPPRRKNGWPVYNGLVIDVSSDLDYLRDKMGLHERRRDTTPVSRVSSVSSQQQQTLVDINSETFKAMISELMGTRKQPPSQVQEPAIIEKIKVGKSLSVPRSIYQQAKNAASPGRMVRPLLRQAFSRRRLMKSTYAGQIRRKGSEHEVRKPGLKRYQKMADIQNFVLDRFPAISQAAFGAIVNSFLGPKANEVHHMQYVEESESGEDDDTDEEMS